MEMQLAGQHAVVVGAARGIGRAIAEEFAKEQATVSLVDCDEVVREVAREIHSQTNENVNAFVCDAIEYSAVKKIAELIVAETDSELHLVYAAGVGSGKFGFPFWNLQPADWQKVLDVNLMGAVNFLHAFAPTLIDFRSGTVLFIASIAGQIGSQTDPPYSASKAALINFAQCAAKDLAEYNVRVNTICPGMIKTTLNRSVWQAWHDQQPDNAGLSYDEWAEAKISQVTPLRRWQSPGDIAALTVFLASARGQNITGQTMNVDGGQVMHW